MINNIRRKVANAISPDKQKSYPLVNIKWATPQRENKRMLKRAHINFEKEFGRKGTNEEVWEWDRKRVNETLTKLGIEPSNPSTEFIPEHFFTGEELEEYYNSLETTK